MTQTEPAQPDAAQSSRATPASFWQNPFARFSERIQKREDQVFLILALLIGAITGLVVVAFILLTERAAMRLYPVHGARWRSLLFPIVGSLGIGYLLYKYFPNARGSGVPQTKAALFARGGYISLKTVIGKFFCTSATLASGIPLGREGPSVQVAAGIASVLGRHLGMRPERVKLLLPLGAAAAIAAAFNTPMAAIVFSLEEIVGDMNAPVLGAVVIASATSWMVMRLILKDNPLFVVPHYQFLHSVELSFYAILGVMGGLVSAAFTRLLLAIRKRFLRFPKKTVWFQPVAGGLLVGIMGWFVPQVMGVGYNYVGDVLNGRMVLRLMVLLVVLKLFAVAVSYASGNAGGIFAPSLFMGSMVGGAVGTVAHMWLPNITAEPGAYALVGMGAVFAGVVRTPMTSVLMIFEMTQDYAIIVPLMIANLVSLFIASLLQKEPIYEALAVQDGIHLPSSHARRDRDQWLIQHVLRAAPEPLPAELTLAEAMDRVGSSPPEDHLHPQTQTWIVADPRGVIGVLNRTRLEQELASDPGRKLTGLLDPLNFPHLHADQSLDQALERMGANQIDLLPVVSRADAHKLEGVVTLHDVLDAYGIGSHELGTS